MRQQLTVSIITDGFGAFLRNVVKDTFMININKGLPCKRDR